MSDLEQYRQEIDELDEQLVRLFLRRMEVTGKVREYKLAHGMQVLDRERERRVLAKRASLAVDIRQEEDVKELFQTIMAISRRRQQELIDRSGTGTVRKTNVVLIACRQREVLRGGGPGGAAGDALVRRTPWWWKRRGAPSRTFLPRHGEACLPPGGDRRRRPGRGHGGDGHLHRRRDHPPARRNMEILSATGTVYFLDRDPRDIANTELDGRPLLSGGRDRVFLLYDQRINLYRKYARYTVPSTTVDETVDSVLALVRRGQDVR